MYLFELPELKISAWVANLNKWGTLVCAATQPQKLACFELGLSVLEECQEVSTPYV